MRRRESRIEAQCDSTSGCCKQNDYCRRRPESDLTDEAVEFQLTIPCIPARYDTASVGVGEGAAQPLGVATEFEVLTAIFVVSLSLAVVFS